MSSLRSPIYILHIFCGPAGSLSPTGLKMPRVRPDHEFQPSQRASSKEERKQEAEECDKTLTEKSWKEWYEQERRKVREVRKLSRIKELQVAVLKEDRFKVLEDGVQAVEPLFR